MGNELNQFRDENKKLYLALVGMFIVLGFSSYLAAVQSGLWNELWITLGYLLLSGVFCAVLLRRSE